MAPVNESPMGHNGEAIVNSTIEDCRFSPGGTQRSVKSSLAVHVLSVFCLLLLAHAIGVVSRHLCVLGASEFGESHASSDELFDVILPIVQIHIHIFHSPVCSTFGIGCAIRSIAVVPSIISSICSWAPGRWRPVPSAVSNR